MRPPAGAARPPAASTRSRVSSGEALRNLVALLGRERVAQAPLFVPHERVAGAARELGLREPVLAGPADAEMLAALVAYFGGAK